MRIACRYPRNESSLRRRTGSRPQHDDKLCHARQSHLSLPQHASGRVSLAALGAALVWPGGLISCRGRPELPVTLARAARCKKRPGSAKKLSPTPTPAGAARAAIAWQVASAEVTVASVVLWARQMEVTRDAASDARHPGPVQKMSRRWHRINDIQSHTVTPSPR
jgi:hypothetical protein